MFKNVLKLKEIITPYDLEQSLLRPQHDPLCAELMSRLIQKKVFKKEGMLPPQNDQGLYQNLDYDTWNMMLAKRFAMMYKNYRKFSIKFLGIDPFVMPEQQAVQNEEQVQTSQENQEVQPINEEEIKEETKQEEQQQLQPQLDTINQLKKKNEKSQIIEESKERITRSRLKKANNPPQNQETNGQQNAQKHVQKKQPEKEPIQLPEQLWSSNVKEHLLSYTERNCIIKFTHESATQWKTETLQIMKLFSEDLQGIDPFYILGQDWAIQNQKEDLNYYNNYSFIDSEQIEDYDEMQAFQNYGKIEVQFKRFHEIPTKSRLDILYFLCQNKLDSEQPEFMQEVQQLAQQKIQKLELEEGQQIKITEEVKQMLDPVQLGQLKPLGIIKEPLQDIKEGLYYYFPFFSDTRLYRQSLDKSEFSLFMEDYDSLLAFIEALKLYPENQDCQEISEKLQKYLELLKKFSDEMKWKEASKVRKLKSQIRSRKLQDNSRKKLQFEGRSSQLQTDFLHHTQGKVMTRKQVDTIKQKIVKHSNPEEQKKKEAKANRFHEQQKEKYEKEKLERQKRLEKRMKLKEGGNDLSSEKGGRLGKRKRDSENEYGDEYDEEVDNNPEQIDTSKRQKTDQIQETTNQDYEILLNGHLLMIYQRDQEDPMKLSILTMVLKGTWRISIEDREKPEEFIYKKIENRPDQDVLLTQLFCNNLEDKIQLPNAEELEYFVINNQQSILDRFISSQGFYQGYFKYNEDDIRESFSMIMKKSHNTKVKNPFSYDLCGFGENDIGPFVLEGTISLLPFEKIQEKDNVKNSKNYIKIKLGKVSMKKCYKQKMLEQLVDEKQGIKNKQYSKPSQNEMIPIKSNHQQQQQIQQQRNQQNIQQKPPTITFNPQNQIFFQTVKAYQQQQPHHQQEIKLPGLLQSQAIAAHHQQAFQQQQAPQPIFTTTHFPNNMMGFKGPDLNNLINQNNLFPQQAQQLLDATKIMQQQQQQQQHQALPQTLPQLLLNDQLQNLHHQNLPTLNQVLGTQNLMNDMISRIDTQNQINQMIQSQQQIQPQQQQVVQPQQPSSLLTNQQLTQLNELLLQRGGLFNQMIGGQNNNQQ